MLRSVVVYFFIGVVLNYAVVTVIVLRWWGAAPHDVVGIPETAAFLEMFQDDSGEVSFTPSPESASFGLVLVVEQGGGSLQRYDCHAWATDFDLPWSHSVPIPSQVEAVFKSRSTETKNVTIAGWPYLGVCCKILESTGDSDVPWWAFPSGLYDNVEGGVFCSSVDERSARADIREKIRVGWQPSNEFLLPHLYLTHMSAYPRVIPITPIWPEFIANVVFYGIVAWLLLHLRWIYHSVVRRKGQCWHCGYNIAAGGQSTCPECGREAKDASRVTPVRPECDAASIGATHD